MEVSGWNRIFSLPKNLPFFRLSLVSVGFRALASMAMNKWIALTFGPAGTAIFGQFINLFAVFSTVSTEGVARGMVREGSYHQGRNADPEVHQVWGSSLWLVVIILVLQWIVFGTIGALTPWAEPFSGSSIWTWLFPALSLLTLAFFSANLFLVRGLTQFQTTQVTGISFGALAGLSVARWLDFTLMQSFLSLTFGQIFVGFSLFAWRWKTLDLHLPRLQWDTAIAKKVITMAMVVSVTTLFSRLADFGLVAWAMQFHGSLPVGIWLAMNRLADSFNIPTLAVVNAILLPMIAKRSANPVEVAQLMKPLFRQLFFWTAIGLSVLFLLYPHLLTVLFSRDFRSSHLQTLLQLTGDFFKTNSYLISGLCLGLGATRFYFWMETTSVVLMLLSTYIFSHLLGPTGLFAAHALRYALFWLFLAMRFRSFLI